MIAVVFSIYIAERAPPDLGICYCNSNYMDFLDKSPFHFRLPPKKRKESTQSKKFSTLTRFETISVFADDF